MNSKRWLPLLSVLLLMANPGRTEKRAPPRAKLSADAEKWVTQTLKKMTLEEKLGQLLMVYYFGGFLSAESEQYQGLLRQVEQNHVGGFVVQTRGTPLGYDKSQVYPTAVLANQLQSHAKVPLLIGADFERGTAMRLEEGTSFPYPMSVAATGSLEDAYTVGKITALEARAVGVHWVFAPVADVNSNPDNPIINTRSFGEDMQRVAECVAAFVRGVEENGALATAKHFPGHGDTSIDSHLDLPRVDGDRKRLDKVELVPFRAAIAAGVSTIMTGHLAVPAIEPDPEVPATLSPKVLTDLLRKQLGFEGIVVTDALDMAGVTRLYPPAEVAVRAILAGADVLLVPPVSDAALAALRDAVASGRIPMSRIDEAVGRVLRAKAKLGLNRQKLVDLEELSEKFARPEFASQAQDIADRGVTLLRDRAHLLPLDPTRPLHTLLLVISADPDPYPGDDFEREVRWRVDSLEVLRADTRFVGVDEVKLPPPESYDLAIVAMFVRVADRKGSVALPEDQASLVERLLAGRKPVVVVGFGSPYLVECFPSAGTWLAAFSTFDVAQRAAARALFGQVAIGGHMPVSVPAIGLKVGDGLGVAASPMRLRDAGPAGKARLKPAFDVLNGAVADGAFPGGVLAVGYRGELTLHAFGKQTYDAKAPAIQPETIYDVASLTKPVVTTTLVAMLVAAGRLDLDAPVGIYLPEWAAGPQPEWRRKVTLRHLLTHTSGLPAHEDYFLTSKGKRAMLAKILAEPLSYEPGTKSEYSDLGFILLGEILERTTGKSLDVLARERIFAPLGMKDSMFNPAKSLRPRIAPTENDTWFRKRQVQGEVHDENAWAMGGVAGHSGLFSTAGDLAAFCQMLLNGGIYAHQRLLRRATIEQFTAAQPLAAGTRALGWTVPTKDSSSGHYFSAHSYGHSGFTGTSIWVDPDKSLFVILLTNRVYPTRENTKIQKVRPALHDAVVEVLGLAPQPQAQR
ncbi:MAG TPA: glycoside hydrolase family 3 N-terminal domain-containing protein [Candidatus Acidoferrales bacterium]|nr:glycoside hydrolase family 3 N-terminal domain-containing protein [Candidatus Acidoferrales bacterium]